jgi:CDGSH-type Zn-finger protein
METRKQSKQKELGDRFKIVVSENGPYLLFGGIPITGQIIVTDADGYSYKWRRGKTYPTQQNYALCRCGKSTTKPFCSGAHLEVNFDGSETASKKSYLDQAGEINGPTLRLTDVFELCASARFCDRAGGIWHLTENSDDREARETAIREGKNCPSGRLVTWDKRGRAIEPEFEPSIGLVEDPQPGVSGPLWVRGGVPIESGDGTVYEVRNRVTLCRCGKSSNKPFCDSSHMQI